MFQNAIVCQPSESLVQGISEYTLGTPDYNLALVQHQAYVEALQSCGLTVTVLEGNQDFPDSMFVEDAALMTPHCAFLTRPGADSRKGEIALISGTVNAFNEKVYQIQAPGTLDAGDVMMVGTHFFIGLSDRTNQTGAGQLIGLLEQHGLSGSTVEMSTMLHLKTGLSYLENNNLLITGEFVGREEFSQYNQIIVDEDEAAAANSVWVNGTVLVPCGNPKTCQKISASDYQVIELDVSEYQKLDGGLSCLSLRF